MALTRYTPLFPFDPKIDSALEHRHLILAYAVVLIAQLVYVAYLVWRYKADRSTALADPGD